MEREQWWKNFRKPFLFAAAARDHKMPLELMRHQQIRPRGKQSPAIKVLPNNSAQRCSFYYVVIFLYSLGALKVVVCGHVRAPLFTHLWEYVGLCMYWKFACMCTKTWRKTPHQKQKKRARAGAFLCLHTPETNPLRRSMLHQVHFHLFGAHLQKPVPGNKELRFCLSGTRQDCVITVGS